LLGKSLPEKLKWFDEIKKHNFSPNIYTFQSLICSCFD